jgi:sugar phosphate isomerase/epimerase
MTLPRLALSVIGDEIGPTLDEMISFCAENSVKRLDMRTVDGRNLMAMSVGEAADIADRLTAAGITIPTFVSPMLKWPAPGKQAGGGKVDFAFDPADCPADDPLAHAFDIAVALGAGRIRTFSYLKYDGYQPEDLMAAVDLLGDLANRWSITVEFENEPVCNVGTIADLAQFVLMTEGYRQFDERKSVIEVDDRWLRPLIDIGNHYFATGSAPSDTDMALLAPICDAIHLKDRKLADKRAMPVGDGDVPWSDELKRLLSQVKVKEVLASIETHCFDDPRNGTARSVAGIRRIAAEIGAELV